MAQYTGYFVVLKQIHDALTLTFNAITIGENAGVSLEIHAVAPVVQ